MTPAPTEHGSDATATSKAGPQKATALLWELWKRLLSGDPLLGPVRWKVQPRNQPPCVGKSNPQGGDTTVCFSPQSQWGPSLPNTGARQESKEVSRWFEGEMPNTVEHRQVISAILWPKPWPIKSTSITECLLYRVFCYIAINNQVRPLFWLALSLVMP